MRPRSKSFALPLACGALLVASCARDVDTLEPAAFPTNGVIFTDRFGEGVGFQGFSGSNSEALSIDATASRTGAVALKIRVPAPGDANGGYAGGAFVTTVPRDLSGYNALTFWARSSVPATLNTAGLGNDNTGGSLYSAEVSGLALTSRWTKYVIPIPNAAKLGRERGMFYFAEGPEGSTGYDIWFDDIQFETVSTITSVRPAIATAAVTTEIGGTAAVAGTTVAYTIDGANLTVAASPNYFTFASSNSAVATISATGAVTATGAGTTTITATLGTTAATGALTLRAAAPPVAAAPVPTRDSSLVISLFSDVYRNVPVDTWSASFDVADLADVTVAGNATKKYTKLGFAGIEFIQTKVNATAMTGIHVDIFPFDAASFKLKLVDFGANSAFGGGDDSEFEISLSPTSTPGLVAGQWNSLDIPLSAFPGLTARANLAQIIISGSSPTVYLDNLYFYRVPAPQAPTVAASTPTAAGGDVVSLFSDAYTNVPASTWSAGYDQADVADVTIAGNAVKAYSNIVFAAAEFTSPTVNATAMTRFHMDIWTPNSTVAPKAFRVKLVDFGANGTFGGGDDSEHELTFNATSTPALTTGAWVGIDVPLTAFAGMTTRANIAQLIISGDLPTVFVDNIYFYRPSAPTAPTIAAPTPTYAATDAISLFSNAYTNVQVDTWSADWDSADLADVKIAGNDTKLYTKVVFTGIEFTSRVINATGMTFFRMDIWTPDATSAPNVFRIKLVDFGANGAFGGGDDREHELTLTATTTPALATGGWVTLDIPLTAFTGLTTRANLAQLIFSGDLKTVYIDNVLLHK